MLYSLIVAVDKNFLVGKDDKLPWHSKEDMAWFVSKTRHKAIIMGRYTALSIGKALPNRFNVAVSTRQEGDHNGILFYPATALAEMEVRSRGFNELVVIGGPTLYDTYLPQVEKIYLTQLEGEHEGNVYFDNQLIRALVSLESKKDIYQGWAIEEMNVVEGVGKFWTFIKVNNNAAHG